MRDLFVDAVGLLLNLVFAILSVPVWVWLAVALLLGILIGTKL